MSEEKEECYNTLYFRPKKIHYIMFINGINSILECLKFIINDYNSRWKRKIRVIIYPFKLYETVVKIKC